MEVPYVIKSDRWGGLGVFAATDIKAGTKVWAFGKANVTVLDEDEAKAICTRQDPAALAHLLRMNYWIQPVDGGAPKMVDIRADDGRFFNHGVPPNVGPQSGSDDKFSTYALVDIREGEELVDDYRTYAEEPAWYSALLVEQGVDVSYIDTRAKA